MKCPRCDGTGIESEGYLFIDAPRLYARVQELEEENALMASVLGDIATHPCLTALLGEDPDEQGCFCAGCHARMVLAARAALNPEPTP